MESIPFMKFDTVILLFVGIYNNSSGWENWESKKAVGPLIFFRKSLGILIKNLTYKLLDINECTIMLRFQSRNRQTWQKRRYML